MMWRKFTTLLLLVLMFCVIMGARYSRYQPPQWLELIATDTFGFRVSDSDGNVAFEISTAGAILTRPTTLAFVAGVGYTVVGPTAGNIFLIPTAITDEPSLVSSSGVTVLIPPPDADNLGWEPTIINTSGTSPMVLFISGQGDTAAAIKTIGTSGTTYVATYDAEGDNVTLGYWEVDGSGVSVFIKSDIIDGT